MRLITFPAAALEEFLLRHKIAALPDLKHALGASSALTVFRKLKQLHYLSSYTHRGSFYTLPGIAGFDAQGLWSFGSAQESDNLPESQLSERSGLWLAWRGEGTRVDEGSWMAWI